MKAIRIILPVSLVDLAVGLLLTVFLHRWIFLSVSASAAVIMLLALIIYLCRAILYPLTRTVETVLDKKNADVDETGVFIDHPHARELKELNLAFYRYKSLQQDPNGAEMFQKQTELMALQSQINPHFLYNTLDMIRGQALLDDAVLVAKMVETLSAFFRYSISGKENTVLLRDEINHTINYMSIQQFRFHNRFRFDVIIDDDDEDALNFMVPRLILQPIVENAIFHGLEDMNENGNVILEVTIAVEELLITISDNGRGMSPDQLNELNDRIHSRVRGITGHDETKHDHTGVALPNINRRIKLLYGDAYGMTVYSSPGQGTDVELVLPIVR